MKSATWAIIVGALSLNICMAAHAAVYTNVKDFGAVGDGVTDDTSAVQSAIASIPAAGGTLYFAAGTYVVGSALKLPNYTRVLGDGRFASAIKMKDGANIPGLIQCSSKPCAYITVQDVGIDGNRANNTAHSSIGVLLVQSSYSALTNLFVHDVDGTGIRISGQGLPNVSRYDTVSNVIVYNNKQIGFHQLWGQRGTTISTLYALQNAVGETYLGYGVFFDASETQATNVFAHENCSGATATTCYGIYIHNVFGSTYTNLTATRNGHEGIVVTEMVASSGSNWHAFNNGSASSNKYADVYFSSFGSDSYGRTQNTVVSNLQAGAYEQYGSGAEAYGLYVEDGPYADLQLMNVGLTGTPLSGKYRLPSSANAGDLTVFMGSKLISGAVSSVVLKDYTVASLPTCTTEVTNAMAAVTDALNPAYNGALSGGGAQRIPVYCDGTTWLAH